jgi:hypothetical protein
MARLRGADEHVLDLSGYNTYNQEKPATSRDASGRTYLSHNLWSGWRHAEAASGRRDAEHGKARRDSGHDEIWARDSASVWTTGSCQTSANRKAYLVTRVHTVMPVLNCAVTLAAASASAPNRTAAGRRDAGCNIGVRLAPSRDHRRNVHA